MKYIKSTSEIIEELFDGKEYSKETQKIYKRCITYLEEETETSISELIFIRNVEEQHHIKWKDSILRKELTYYKNCVFENYKEETAKIYLDTIIEVFEFFGVKIYDLSGSAVSTTDVLVKNQEYSAIIEEKLGLEVKPVAIKLLKSENDIPDGFKLIDEKLRHCEMVKKAFFGHKFYSTIHEQKCLGGAGAIGLRDMPEKIVNGEKYYSLGRFKDLATAKDLASDLSIVEGKYWGIAYSPLDKADFEADVIQIITEPVNGMKLAQSIVYSTGEKIEPSFAGIQSVCGDAFAQPYNEDGINFTLGCDGSRKEADIRDNEMIIGISKEKIDDVISGLVSI